MVKAAGSASLDQPVADPILEMASMLRPRSLSLPIWSILRRPHRPDSFSCPADRVADLAPHNTRWSTAAMLALGYYNPADLPMLGGRGLKRPNIWEQFGPHPMDQCHEIWAWIEYKVAKSVH
jgi:hypothetical protein